MRVYGQIIVCEKDEMSSAAHGKSLHQTAILKLDSKLIESMKRLELIRLDLKASQRRISVHGTDESNKLEVAKQGGERTSEHRQKW